MGNIETASADNTLLGVVVDEVAVGTLAETDGVGRVTGGRGNGSNNAVDGTLREEVGRVQTSGRGRVRASSSGRGTRGASWGGQGRGASQAVGRSGS